ncbi:NRPS [Lepraria neglecta]|uniref:NRPS n=1 Tax=Lepraria neglecta TaxID=209136 RepID=A0AAD9Z4D0_9LECA|nr:NRPS [Lepraria neglecta]
MAVNMVMPSQAVQTPPTYQLRQYCSEHGVKLESLLKLSWAIILSLYFDTPVFVFNGPVDNRREVAAHSVLVHYVQDFAKQSTVVDTLRSVNSEYPAKDPVLYHREIEEGASQLPKIWSQLLLVPSDARWQSDAEGVIDGRGFDVELIVALSPSGLSVGLRQVAKLDEINDLANVARAFSEVLQSILADSSQPVAEVSATSAEDFETLRIQNAVSLAVREECLHLLIERSVAANASLTALISWDGSLTYSELSHLSSQLACYLIREYDIGVGVVVPMCFEKSIWAPVAMLAVLKTGASYCFVDPTQPQPRRDYITAFVDAKIGLCGSIHRTLIQTCPTVVVDPGLLRGLDTPGALPPTGVKPEDPCIVLFTSGTSGNPKAVVHSHTSITSGLMANAPFQDINRSSVRVFQWAAYTFDVSITETLGPLIFGGTTCIPSEEERFNHVDECMTRYNVDWAYFTPTFARFFKKHTILSLKQLILGGEAVTVDDVRNWCQKVKVLNAYGPAESITWFLEPQLGVSDIISIGGPINTHAWIVHPDDHEKLLPIGAIGELLFEGPSNFSKYIKNNEKTKSVLIDPPRWRKAMNIPVASKLYKSGDLVRYLPGPGMTYVGRKDTMVKIYGQRMELDEAEAMLRRSLPQGFESSADVIKPAGESGEPTLVAFLNPPVGYDRSKLPELKLDLQAKLSRVLPAFMVPRIYIPVDTMPYSASRKLDRAKLKHGVASMSRKQLMELIPTCQLSSTPQRTQDLNAVENELLKLWADVLSLEPNDIGLHDNFFTLGGTSVIALRLVAKANSRGLCFFYAELFQGPTVHELAKIVSSRGNTEGGSVRPFALLALQYRGKILDDATTQCDVAKEEIEDIYPQSPQQEGLWALSLIAEGDYMAQNILTLEPDVDVERFKAAWEQIATLTPTLRTRFIQSQSGSYQAVLRQNILWQTPRDLGQYLQDDIWRPLEFGAQLVRYAIIPPTETQPRTRIVWTCHHALFDGESVPMLLNAVAKMYDGEPPSPSIGPLNNFVKYTQTLDKEAAAKWWRNLFDPIEPVIFPELPHPKYRPRPSSELRKHIQFTRKLGSSFTTATLLRAAWALTMVNVSQTWNVTIGVTLAGRTAPVRNIESVIGPTFVTLPTRSFCDEDASVLDYLRGTQSAIIEMIPFEHTGMQEIASFSDRCNQACQFQNILLIQTPDDVSYERLFKFDHTTGGLGRFNSHALMVLVYTRPHGIDVAFSYDGNIVDNDRIRDLAYRFEHFIHILCLEEDNRSLRSILATQVETERSLHMLEMDTQESAVAEEKAQKDAPKGQRDLVMEKRLASMWVEILQLSDNDMVLADDEFVKTYGGNSLSSIKLAQACRSNGILLSVKDIFQYPRLDSMAKVAKLMVADENKNDSIAPYSLIGQESLSYTSDGSADISLLKNEAAAACEISVDSIVDVYPATPLQEGFLTLSMTHPGSYISTIVYELAKDIDLTRFYVSLGHVYKEVEVLRTRIAQLGVEQRSFQIVLSSPLRLEHLQGLNDYFAKSKTALMSFGTQLTRFAIIKDNDRKATFFGLQMHHSTYDGWSMGMLLNRVFDKYVDTNSAPQNSPANRFIKVLLSQNSSSAQDFWLSKLQGAAPSAFPEGLKLSLNDGKQLTEERTLQLPDLTGSGIRTSTVLRAAWAWLISMYTNNHDVVFGETFSGRNIPMDGINELIAPTVTTVPMRITIDGEEKAESFLRRVQNLSDDLTEHEHFGLQSIRKIAPEACDFQNLLVIQPSSNSKDYSSLWVSEVHGDTSKFLTYPLVVQCNLGEDNDSAQTTLTFDESHVHPSQASRILALFQTLVLKLHERSSAFMKEIEVVGLEGTSEITQQIQRRAAPVCVNELLHDLVLKRSRVMDAKSAVESAWEGELSYSELVSLATRLSTHLHGLGARPGKTIPISFDKSIWAIVAMLSVLFTGAAFVPIDPALPKARRELLISRIAPPMVITSLKHKMLFESSVIICDRLSIESLPDFTENGRESFENPSVEDPAYVLFTSGSTGLPKGVVIPHRAVCSSIFAHGSAMHFNSKTRALQFCSYTFDVMIAEIFTTLCFGGTVCVPSPNGRLNDLAGEVNTLRVNWAFLTPTVARLLDPASISTIETLVLGGEEVRTDDVDHWCQTPIRLMNGFGPTEASVFCVTREINSSKSAKIIGEPIGCWAFVVDPKNYNRLLPLGAPGELLVCGPVVGTGYLSDVEATKQAFVSQPAWASEVFSKGSVPHSFYKTGDLARYDTYGSLYYHGRKDTQIKVRGQRIELGEVERRIQDNPQIDNAVVCVPKNGSFASGTRLVGVASLKSPGPSRRNNSLLELLDAGVSREYIAQLKEHCTQHLPAYAVPNLWVLINAVPLSSASKTDRRTVSMWLETLNGDEYGKIISMNESGGALGPKPETALEHRLANVWSTVLNIPLADLLTNKSFWAYGGDSVSAIRLVKKCKESSLSITIENLLSARGISELSQNAGSQEPGKILRTDCTTPSMNGTKESSLRLPVGISPSDVESISPCTPMQEHMLANEAQGFYHLQMRFDVDLADDLDVSRLEKAWYEVMNRHSALRIVFVGDEEHPKNHNQAILRAPAEKSCIWKDQSSESTLNTALVQNTNSWENNEPWHHLTLQRNDSGHISLILEISHAITDAVSLGIIFNDLALAYDGRLPRLPAAQFPDFLAELRRSQIESSLYWRDYLSGAKPCLLTTDSMLSPSQIQLLHTPLSHPGTYHIIPFCKRAGISVSHFFQIAWALLLRSYLDSQEDVSFGYVTSNRDADLEGVESIVGPLLCTLVCRQQLPDSKLLRDSLTAVRDDAVNSMSKRYCDMQRIEAELGLSGKGLFNTMVNFRRYSRPPTEAEKPSISFIYRDGLDPWAYDLLLTINEVDSDFEMQLVYPSTSMSKESANRLARKLEMVMDVVIEKVEHDEGLKTVGDVIRIIRTKVRDLNMHELLLFGQVQASRHDQVLNILAGFAAMQPVPFLENHLIFKPKRLSGPARPVQVGGAQDIQKSQQALQAQAQGDLFYMQLVTDVADTASTAQTEEDQDAAMNDNEENGTNMTEDGKITAHAPDAEVRGRAAKTDKWTLQFRDLPEVARQRPVTSRLIADIPIISGNPMQFMSALDYTHTATYLLSGHRFTHLSTSLLFYRLLLPSTPTEQASNPSKLDISQARLLDPSGTYILQAAVRVPDGSKVETMSKGVNELLSLKETLKGVVELEMGERLALDTRVR